MKKKVLLMLAICTIAVVQVKAQSDDKEEKKGGFKKENLFTGGTVALGFGSGTTSFGVGPYFGYSINKYLDVAVSLNYNYISQRDYYYDIKYRQSIVGPGAFVRIFPVKFLFAQAQFEQNYIKQKTLYASSFGIPNETAKVNASSFLIGPGYAGGREEGSKVYYYFSVLFDVAKNTYSPYVDNQGRVNPIFRAGLNISLFGGKEADNGRYRRRSNY